MTSNTSPKKPDWFALVEKDAPSAQVRKVDKRLPAITGFLAIAIVALGTFFANGSMSAEPSITSNSVASTISASTSVNAVTSAQVSGKVKATKVAESQSNNKIADPTLNGGGNDDDDDDDRDDDDDDRDDDDDHDDDDRD